MVVRKMYFLSLGFGIPMMSIVKADTKGYATSYHLFPQLMFMVLDFPEDLEDLFAPMASAGMNLECPAYKDLGTCHCRVKIRDRSFQA